MVGHGVMLECLADDSVGSVLSIVRGHTGQHHAKLCELVHGDFLDYTALVPQLSGYDACFFCLGVSTAGMTEAAYERITFGFTLAAAEALVRLNPRMTFIYVSGAGTDSSEHGRTMWARVKGRTENQLLRLPFAGAYMFRPGLIQPRRGVRSKTPAYRLLYGLMKPVLPMLRWCFPRLVTTTEEVGRAMLIVARRGASKRNLENRDIVAIAQQSLQP